MKAYGHTRKDKIECKYGCCTTKSGKKKNCRDIVDKTKHKKARQVQKKECKYIEEKEEVLVVQVDEVC